MKPDKSNNIALFLALVIISIASISQPAQAQVQTEKTTPSISVSATGSQSATPDMALITLGVQRQARTAREALSQNNAAMKAVLNAMKGYKIEEKDLQTSGFNIQPRFNYPNNRSSDERRPPEIIGYMVSSQLSIRIRDLAVLGDILDKSVSLGVNSGGNIRFLTANPETALNLARTKAMENAINKAKTLTSAAGINLGKILSISENTNIPRPLPMRDFAMARSASAESVPVAAGENTYSVTVQVRWEIRQ